MDKHNGQSHLKSKAKQVLQIRSGRRAGHKDDAGLNHLRNFPFVMDKGNTKVELPDFDAGRLLTVFTPGGWKHEIHLRSLLIKIHIALTCNFSVGKTHGRISFSSFPHLFNRYNVIIARFHQNATDIPSSFSTNVYYLHKKSFLFRPFLIVFFNLFG